MELGYDLIVRAEAEEPSMFVEVVTSAVLEQAWHERQRIWQFAKDLLNAATKGKFRIYAFGPGGVGKTTLATWHE